MVHVEFNTYLLVTWLLIILGRPCLLSCAKYSGQFVLSNHSRIFWGSASDWQAANSLIVIVMERVPLDAFFSCRPFMYTPSTKPHVFTRVYICNFEKYYEADYGSLQPLFVPLQCIHCKAFVMSAPRKGYS